MLAELKDDQAKEIAKSVSTENAFRIFERGELLCNFLCSISANHVHLAEE